MNEVSWEELEVGKYYMVEDKYYFQAKKAKIMKIEVEGEIISVRFHVIEPMKGCSKRFYTWSKNLKVGLYLTASMKFMPVGSCFSYA